MSTSKMKDLPVTRISDSFFSDTDHSDCKIWLSYGLDHRLEVSAQALSEKLSKKRYVATALFFLLHLIPDCTDIFYESTIEIVGMWLRLQCSTTNF